jgi:hypothetical protein
MGSGVPGVHVSRGRGPPEIGVSPSQWANLAYDGVVLEAVLVVVLFAAGLAAIVAFSRWHAARIERFWRTSAGRMGGELTFRAGWFDVDCSLAVVLDGQRVTVTRGRKQDVFARAEARHPPGFELKVHPRPPNWLANRANSVTTGDPTFDTLFATDATHAELATTWLDAAVRERISRAGHVWLHVRDGAVVATRAVYEFEEDPLERLARAVAAMAGKGAHGAS